MHGLSCRQLAELPLPKAHNSSQVSSCSSVCEWDVFWPTSIAALCLTRPFCQTWPPHLESGIIIDLWKLAWKISFHHWTTQDIHSCHHVPTQSKLGTNYQFALNLSQFSLPLKWKFSEVSKCKEHLKINKYKLGSQTRAAMPVLKVFKTH